MGWKKNWNIVKTSSPISGAGTYKNETDGYLHNQVSDAYRNYQSTLQDVYSGHSNRISRYTQYESMDADSEVNSALDILAEFSTQISEVTKTPFNLKFNERPTDNEVSILKDQIAAWSSLNKLNTRIFKIFRNVIKYGDQVFIRDPETFEMSWVEPSKVTKIIVNESEGKLPQIYYIKDISPNFENLTITAPTSSLSPLTSQYTAATFNALGTSGFSGDSRFSATQNEMPIDAENIVHLSMSEGLDQNWPFGVSILESVFKTFKQKELIEDALLIYRIQRAPERRIFYIETGALLPNMSMQYVERIKNEINQKRIPTQNGGGANIMDSNYNPMSISEDYFFPQREGKGSKVEVLPGGSNLGEIDDLQFFTNKLFRGLRIPSSYLPTGAEDSGAVFSDGKATTALIQEYRFNKYCTRLQSNVNEVLDTEFKLFLKFRGFNIDNKMFSIELSEPQNFAAYREISLNNERINGFNQLKDVEFLSKRFLLKKYLGLTDIEMSENDQMWEEEQAEVESEVVGSDMRNIGITPGGIQGDMDTMDGIDDIGDMDGDMGDDMGGDMGSDAPPSADTVAQAPPEGNVD